MQDRVEAVDARIAVLGQHPVHVLAIEACDLRAKYPTFEAVVAALKKNDEFKYNLVTALEGAPLNSALDINNRKGIKSK